MPEGIPEKYRDLFQKRAFANLSTLMPDGRPQVNLFMSRAAYSDLDLAEFQLAIRTRIPDSGSVRIHATSAARCTISFVADGLVQTGFSFYRLVRDLLSGKWSLEGTYD